MGETQDKLATPIVVKKISGGLDGCDRGNQLAKELVLCA
jgi:hypothetical protein